MTKNKGIATIIEEPTIIELDTADVALIFHGDGQMSLFIPQMDENEKVPDYIVYLTMLGALLSNEDQELLSLVDRKLEESINQIKEDKENQPDE